ncbi:primosomal protein N' [Silvanigrella sp.]|jgi:primosomal protein N' (replication factor Y)|uniref:replication restart helicase PriA n=1 Tax=Silvanigrella sp. TaxID=2024976 RepID=UPI0037C5AE95
MEFDISQKKYGNFVVIAATGLFLTYQIPEKFLDMKLGKLCLVPMRQGKSVKTFVALFLEFTEKPHFPCQEIISYVPFTNQVPEVLISIMKWVAEYYLFPFERVLPNIAPKFVWNVEKHSVLFKRLSKFFHIDDKNQYYINQENNKKGIKGETILPLREQIDLSSEQENVYHQILLKPNSVCLLHGVTGSGKTEIYLKIAQNVIQNKKTVLILVPEIALTPQMSSRFRAVFQNDLAILHSGLTSNEYEKEWFKIHLGFVKIVLGVRTSIFTLLENIGLIIVDEEHDGSYKSQDLPPYQARDIAVLRAKKEKALCILGSATPSVETMYNALQGKYEYFKLENKYSNNTVDSIIIDSKKNMNLPSKLKEGNYPLKSTQISFQNDSISSEVCSLLKEKKDKGEQSIVIINRRGYINFAICAECTSPLKCPRCSVTTTLHQNGSIEICHYCGYRENKRKNCPTCHSTHFLLKGIGTQNIEEQIQTLIPNLKIDRLDRDVLTSNTKLNEIIENFRIGKTDCLVGTQMLAKGHDFPKVTLVVILHVEDSLFLPDFRASERTFQLLTQAMGRAGRGEKKGTVVLQSLIIGHPVIEMSLNNKVDDFMNREISLRKIGFHPPFSRQILFEIRHRNKEKALTLSNKLKEYLVSHWKLNQFNPLKVRLAGPYSATIEKIRDEFRMQLCISSSRDYHPFILFPKEISHDKELISCLRIDVDPYSFL